MQAVRVVREWTCDKYKPRNSKSAAVANTRKKQLTEVPDGQDAHGSAEVQDLFQVRFSCLASARTSREQKEN